MALFLIEITLSPAVGNRTESFKNKLNHAISWDFQIFSYLTNKLYLLMYNDNFSDYYFNRKLSIIEHSVYLLNFWIKKISLPKSK